MSFTTGAAYAKAVNGIRTAEPAAVAPNGSSVTSGDAPTEFRTTISSRRKAVPKNELLLNLLCRLRLLNKSPLLFYAVCKLVNSGPPLLPTRLFYWRYEESPNVKVLNF